MSGDPSAPPDSSAPSGKRGRHPLTPAPAILLSIFAAIILVAVYLVAAYLTTRQAAADSRTEGFVVVTSRTSLYAASDPLPADISEEDYAAFWNEPALNTPDSLALLDVINEGWKARIRENEKHLESRLADISDPAKRANAQAAVDELSELLAHGSVQGAKRAVYSDLAQLAQQTCHRGAVDGVSYLANGHPIRNWAATHPQVLTLRGSPEYTRRATLLVGEVYPAAFEAALPHICKFPPPPESSHPGDAELMASVGRDAGNLLDLLRVRPNAEGYLPEDEYEAFWNSPPMTSPAVRAYLDRVGEKAVSDYRESATSTREEIDQIADNDLREHAHQYLDWVLEHVVPDGAALDGSTQDTGRSVAVGKVYADLEEYWSATCTSEPSRWDRPTPVKRNLWTSSLEPEFSPEYVRSARSSGDAKWNEATFDLAVQFYPDAYEAGVGYYCR